MHHMYPLAKGDQLCPLGFHPQVRWPTRCKRCFRDYKEHGGKRGSDDIAASSPALTDSSNSRGFQKPGGRSWTSTQNLSASDSNGSGMELKKRPSSWTSTPDLEDSEKISSIFENSPDVSLSVSLPQRRHTTTLDMKELEESFTIRRPPLPPSMSTSLKDSSLDDTTIKTSDSLAERVRKMNLLKRQNSQERESSREKSLPRQTEKEPSPCREREVKQTPSTKLNPDPSKNRAPIPSKKVETPTQTSSIAKKPEQAMKKSTAPNRATSDHQNATSKNTAETRKKEDTIKQKQDVQFLIQVKQSTSSQKQQDDNLSMTTETTDTTLVGANDNELQEEINNLKYELDAMKSRAERAERDKSDILLRRLAAMDTGSNRTAASEALKLQQKVNELKSTVEELKDEKRCYSLRVKELEQDLNSRPAKTVEDEVRRKLQAAEQLCEELMDENEDIKKELRGMEQEIDEMHDNFREDQAEEFTTLRKEMEQTTKNCRILSFKLKKSERKIEQLENDKQALNSQTNTDLASKVKHLEEELRLANEATRRLQDEAEQAKNPGAKKRPPSLGVIGKSTSADGKFSRESLTRGGSQEDPQQLLRDLQDSIEREADLKEQLKFAEEEAENLRKKASRIEDENESLMMQLKKMATKARSRKLSPTPSRLTPEPAVEHDEGISDEDDPAELRVLLELNEQEASVLRQKVEDLESENTETKKQIRELQERLRNSPKAESNSKRLPSLLSKTNLSDKKTKALEDELADLRKQISEKDQNLTRLKSEISTSKTTTASNGNLADEVAKVKESLIKAEKERDDLSVKLKIILQEACEKLPPRTPKKFSDLTPKSNLKKMVEDLELEVTEMRAVIFKSGADQIFKLAAEKLTFEKQLKEVTMQLNNSKDEIKKLQSTKSTAPNGRVSELEQKIKKSEEESNKLTIKIKENEEKLKKQDSLIKQIESAKNLVENQLKREKEKIVSVEKDYEKEKKERARWEAKVGDLDQELHLLRKNSEKIKAALEKEIADLKSKNPKADNASKKLVELSKQNEELQTQITKDNEAFSKLSCRFEQLEEEHVLVKAKLSTENQRLQMELNGAKQKSSEMETLKSDKLELNKRLKEAEKRLIDLESKNLKSNSAQYEKNMLKSSLEEKERQLAKLRQENEMNLDFGKTMKKDNEDLRSKLDDYEKVIKIQRSMADHNKSLENEIKRLKARLENAELTTKSEVASTRLRYEQQVKNMQAELNNMQRQCERFKKDRDSFKQLLESAQKTIGELKQNSGRQSRGSVHSGDEDDKNKILFLDQQVGCLEDQLCDARLDVSRLKNELVSERSAAEIKISEMTSKLNEHEEDRLIASGRTKIAGMKTKLELSWQKEREDQQRLLQETSTLARDLRQTLFEVERERDKERVESKRKLDQLKRANDEELEEGRKKISELQCDLLDLRDAHAKLRTSNERMRRERERYERELIRRRFEMDGEKKVGLLLQTVDELVKIAPDLTSGAVSLAKIGSQSKLNKPEHPRSSRSPSPGANTTVQMSGILSRLAEASDEIRRYQRLCEEEKERDRTKRGGMRRAASTENENQPLGAVKVPSAGRIVRSSTHNGSLYRKSLSLDQSIQQPEQSIWRREDDSMSSIQSIGSDIGGINRDSSMDSRLSGGSTQSDIPRPRKKKKGLMGKLRSLTKGRSAESEGSVQGSDSDVSLSNDLRSSKRDLKGRLSGMFKRSGSASRSGSAEQILNAQSQQRPVSVTIVGNDDAQKRQPPPLNATTPKPTLRTATKPPTPITPITQRKNK